MSNQEVELGEVRSSDPENPNKVEIQQAPIQLKGSGVFFCTLSLIGSRMGAGIVGLPFATQNIGFVTSLVIEIIYSITATLSMLLLLKVREITGESSLSSIGYFCFGRISIFFINILTAITQLGFPIIFFIVFGDVAGGLIEKVNTSGISFWSSRWFTHTILAVTVIYFILQKDIHSLRYTGFMLLILIALFLFLYFIHYLTSFPHPTTTFEETTLNIKFFASLPTIIASYSVHPSFFFTAFSSLKNKTMKNGVATSILSISILFCVYICSPLIAFGVYGSKIKSNMLLNIASDSGALTVVLLFIFMAIAIMHIPIIFFVGKEAVLIIFDEATRRSYSRRQVYQTHVGTPEVPHESDSCIPVESQLNSARIIEVSEEENEKSNIGEIGNAQNSIKSQSGEVGTNSKSSDNPPFIQAPNPKEYLNMKPVYYYLITVISYIVVVILSIVIGDVAIFFGIIGSVVSSFMVLAGPGTFYIVSFHKKKIGFNGVGSILTYIFAWTIAIVGATCMVGLTICVILKAIGF